MTHFNKTLLVLFSLLLVACSGPDKEQSYPVGNEDKRRQGRGKLTGEGMKLKMFGGDKNNNGSYGSGIGVNSFLWRATLDALSFMPLASVDPHGGVIITEWYEDPAVRGEKFKINVLILGTALRADGVRVSVFKKVRDNNGDWVDAAVPEDTARKMEDVILTRARELRIQSVKIEE